MDSGSPNDNLEESRDVHIEDGLGFVGKRSGELDLNLVASKEEEGDEDFGHEKDAVSVRRIDMDLNQEEPRKFPELSAEISVNLSSRRSESPLPKSRSPSPVPLNSLPTVRDESYCDDLDRGKSPTPVAERQNSDNDSCRSLSPSCSMGRESLDYSLDKTRSLVDSKSCGDERVVVTGDSCSGSPSHGQIASFDNETEKGYSAPNFGKPSLVMNTDCSAEDMERENSDSCEQKSVAIHDETMKETVDHLSEKSLFESVHEKLEVGSNHHLEELQYPDESKYHCRENFDQHSGKLPSPARAVYSDDEPKKENFYPGKSPSPENSKPYNGELETGDSYIHSPGRTPKRSASPVRRQMSVSPYRSPYEPPSSEQQTPSTIKDIQEPLNSEARGSQLLVSDPSRSAAMKNKSSSPGSPRRKRSRSPSPKRVPLQENLRLEASPYARRLVSPVRHPSPLPGRLPMQDAQRRNDSPRNHLSASPRRRYSPPGSQRRRDRSVSRSPIRRRDSYSGSRGDYREGSRSRSPYSRDRYRRSSRRRYSPRRRSPASGYHSRYRSPRRPWSPPPNRSTGIGKPGNNLFVAGFSFVTTERDLEKKFSRFGRVTDVRIVRDKRSGDSRGFGFLSLERDEDADAAIRALDQTEWNGRVVLVEKSKTHAR